MANNKAALKRIRTNERNRINNRRYKSTLKTVLKAFLKAEQDFHNYPSKANFLIFKTQLSVVYKQFDKCVKVNILHKNNASRKKSKCNFLFQRQFLVDFNRNFPYTFDEANLVSTRPISDSNLTSDEWIDIYNGFIIS